MIHQYGRPWFVPVGAGISAATTLWVAPALAAGSNMPWEQPLQQVLVSVQGPVLKIIAVLIIIVTGLTLAFGDTSGGFRRLIQAIDRICGVVVLFIVFLV
jgi:type IV secretion system protein TrbC